MYVELMARVYDQYWGPYPRRIAGQLLKLFAETDVRRQVLDIGCGTGLVAEKFVDAGYHVTGLEYSPSMLAHARKRLNGKTVELFEGDARDFTVPEKYPFVMSTFDVVNHIGPGRDVKAFLRCAQQALESGGVFAFDMSTWRGLRTMHGIQVRDDDAALLVIRGALSDEDRIGYLRISGVVRADDGRYDRFETSISNHAFDVDEMVSMIAETGLELVRIASPDDIFETVEKPEDATRVVFITTQA